MSERCCAETRVKRNGVNHTVRCDLEPGHDGAHRHRHDGARQGEVIWYGEAQSVPIDMRYRFGLPPGWGNE